jgi:uncharacterized membrane protein YjgN (DUF898 family)
MDGDRAPTTGETLNFGQTIAPKSFVGLSLKNGLLNIITLTLYRFWGKTEVRRRVWSHVTLNGEPFEYIGRGKELFLGFLLVVLTVGVPYLALILAVQFVSPLFGLLFLPIYFGFIVLIGMAIFMTYRYQASRTVWRGLRFQVRGKASSFGWAYLGYALLSGVTLGWYSPVMTMKVAERLWGSISYGDQPLTWDRANKNNLFGPFAIAWVVGIFGYLALIFTLMGPIMASSRAGTEPSPLLFVQFYAYAVVYALVLVIASAAYHAAVLREIAASIRIGGARLAIRVGAGDYMGLVLSNLAILLLSLGFLRPVVMARTARFLVSRLSSEGTAPLAEAHQAPRGPKTGEGLADAFDVSPF